MRFLGIDYGKKRVGIAVSDEGNTIAFPKEVFPTDGGLLARIGSIVEEYDITAMVLGESKNFKGEDNTIMSDIRSFKKSVEEKLHLEVIMEPEFMTSSHAAQSSEGENLDAAAAALILQSYLDKRKVN